MQKQPETPSEIIKAARDKSDLTVEELTDRVGITERYLYRIENEGKVPTFEVLKKIVRELAILISSQGYHAERDASVRGQLHIPVRQSNCSASIFLDFAIQAQRAC